MSHENYEINVPKATSGSESEGLQPSEEAFGGQTQRETPLQASAFDTEKPKSEPSGDNAAIPEDSNPYISKELEEQPAGAANEATFSAKEVSDRKRAANGENAKRSTGPKTPEGKAKSSRNSYKHGIFSAGLVRRGEMEKHDRGVFEEIVNLITGYYHPIGFMEVLLVEKITTEAVRFRRLLGYEQLELGTKAPFWDEAVNRVLRYQATINRQLFQAMEQLERLQAKRKEQSKSSDSNQSAFNESGDEPTNADNGENGTRADCPDDEEEKR